jgi:hypothetical protein
MRMFPYKLQKSKHTEAQSNAFFIDFVKLLIPCRLRERLGRDDWLIMKHFSTLFLKTTVDQHSVFNK